MILDDAIIELFDQGIYDPARIESMLAQRGNRWLSRALVERSSRLIREHVRELAQKRTVLLPPLPAVTTPSARHSDASPRSSSPATYTPAAAERVAMREEYGTLEWLPGSGYKPLRDFTSGELRSAAAYKRQLAGDIIGEADRLETLADQLDESGAATLGGLGIEVAA